MSPNACGNCTACCRVFAIPEFDKKAGDWCKHCDVGKGCKIYEKRPYRCAEFQCVWLQGKLKGDLLPDALRPDRCKVVFSATTNPKIMTALTMPGRPDAWKSPTVMKFIEFILRQGIAVAVGPPAADAQYLIRPDGSIRKINMTPPDADGMQWSKEEA